MRAPVWNYTVGAVRCVAPAAVSHDRMIRNTRRNRQLVDRLHEPIVGFERIDAVWHSVERSGRRIGDQERFGCSVDGGKESRSSDESSADPANPVRGQFAAAMRRRNKYHPL